jgi:hypothetical protein
MYNSLKKHYSRTEEVYKGYQEARKKQTKINTTAQQPKG